MKWIALIGLLLAGCDGTTECTAWCERLFECGAEADYEGCVDSCKTTTAYSNSVNASCGAKYREERSCLATAECEEVISEFGGDNYGDCVYAAVNACAPAYLAPPGLQDGGE